MCDEKNYVCWSETRHARWQAEGNTHTERETSNRNTRKLDKTIYWPMVSPSGPLVAQMDCSRGWNNLKQKPSFLDGLSISSHVLSSTVPTQWLLCKQFVSVKVKKCIQSTVIYCLSLQLLWKQVLLVTEYECKWACNNELKMSSLVWICRVKTAYLTLWDITSWGVQSKCLKTLMTRYQTNVSSVVNIHLIV